jgi:hypothetical protein
MSSFITYLKLLPLHYALFTGNIEVLQCLLSHAADLNKADVKILSVKKFQRHFTGNLGCCKSLQQFHLHTRIYNLGRIWLHFKLISNFVDRLLQTPLHDPASKERTQCALELLLSGAIKYLRKKFVEHYIILSNSGSNF